MAESMVVMAEVFHTVAATRAQAEAKAVGAFRVRCGGNRLGRVIRSFQPNEAMPQGWTVWVKQYR